MTKSTFMKQSSFFLTLCLLITSLALQAQVEIYSSSSNNSTSRITINRNGINSFNVEMRGQIELTDDDKDIKSISADGYLEITKTTFGGKRTLVFSPMATGVKREYYEGRDKVDFEKEGRLWMGEILP